MEIELGENESIVDYGSKMVCPKCDETISEILEIHKKRPAINIGLDNRKSIILACPKCRVILGAMVYP